MTVIAEDLEKTIDSILENMEKRIFPLQRKTPLPVIAKDNDTTQIDTVVYLRVTDEKLILMTLELCEIVLLNRIDSFITGILNEEDYEVLKNHYQTQKNLIAVMLQEMIKVL